MLNHVHLLMTPLTAQSISKVMQSLGRYYVQYFNYQYKRTGTLWEGRYKSTLLDSETYLLTCYRYIEMNPVRAGMVDHPSDYPWSSYACNAAGKADPMISPHALYICNWVKMMMLVGTITAPCLMRTWSRVNWMKSEMPPTIMGAGF